MACAINVNVPCACCKAAKKSSKRDTASKELRKTVACDGICDSFTRWRAHVFGFAIRHEHRGAKASLLKNKATKGIKKFSSTSNCTPRTLLARSAV